MAVVAEDEGRECFTLFCSEYGKWSVWTLIWMGLGIDARQLVKCQAWGKYGYDNVGMILAHE